MYCRVLACDFDGTGAYDGRLAPEVAAALTAARAHGIRTLLVTGRVREDLVVAGVGADAFDVIVAENGAVVWFPATGREILTAEPPPPQLLAALRDAGIPFHAGRVVIGTWDQHAAQLLKLVRRLGLDQQLVFNRAAVMLLPSGVNKAVGVERALAELGLSEHNMVAFGDAENDAPLLAAAEFGVAARGAVPTIAASADEQLSHPGGEGVGTFIRRLLEAGGQLPTPARHHIVLGRTDDGALVTMPAAGANVLVSGDPRSGKSWLGGLVAELLLDREYRLCIIDPEGDHTGLSEHPWVLGLGCALPLPPPPDVAGLLATKPLSVVVNLAALSEPDKVGYVEALLDALAAVRAARGVPHWTLIDEAHCFLHAAAPDARRFDTHFGSHLFMTYRPSLLAPTVHAAVSTHLLTHTGIDDERYFLTALLQQVVGSEAPRVADRLAGLATGATGMLRLGDRPRFTLFAPAERTTRHVHHARKYIDQQLPEHKAFRFLYSDTPQAAHNVAEFCRAVTSVPAASLQHHLLHNDFSRWARDVLGDDRLAAGLDKLERAVQVGGRPNAQEIVRHVHDRFAF